MPILNIKWLIVAATFRTVILFLARLPQGAIPCGLQMSGLDKLAHALASGAIVPFRVVDSRDQNHKTLL